MDWYTTDQAARILRLSNRRVQQLATAGDLEGERTGRGWRLAQWSVHAYLEENPPQDAPESPETPATWVDRVADLERQLGRLEGRLELTEVAESTLREQLQRERERADMAENKAAELEAELALARRPWWRKLVGG